MKPSHKWLCELTAIPTTSGHEARVASWVEAWVRRRSDLALEADGAGNLLITQRRHSRRPPVIATAHMDHPGWVVEEVDGRAIRARFMGGVLRQYFDGARVELFHRGERVTAVVEAFDEPTGVLRQTSAGAVEPGDIGRWAFSSRRIGIRRDRLHAVACDDLAGAAAALTALDRARKLDATPHFGVLLTRAEEEGLLGAIAACELGTIPPGARLLSIETSRSFADSPIGAGPIIRVGDRSSVFDAELTNQVTDAVRATGLSHQRKLMAGGSCEATAFGAYGHTATGLCLALGNYHNMADIDGVLAGAPARLAPEVISLDDYDGLVDLMLVAARLETAADPIRRRLAQTYASRKDLLGLT